MSRAHDKASACWSAFIGVLAKVQGSAVDAMEKAFGGLGAFVAR